MLVNKIEKGKTRLNFEQKLFSITISLEYNPFRKGIPIIE